MADPIFRLSYSEHEVAGRLQQLLREPKDEFSVTIPVSRQNKGWDMLISARSGRAARIQVKASRCYFEHDVEKRGYSHVFWFNNFRDKLAGADFFVLFGVSPSLDIETRRGRGFPKKWNEKAMVLSSLEVDILLPEAKEKFFYVGFDERRPDLMLCLDGRKNRLAEFSYNDIRSTTRAEALKSFLSRDELPEIKVRRVPKPAA